ncbi:MAG TPA: hypothetical protein VL992_13920 [Tepidisphaeraceae bacterium]|nr:hypothetical protein [Tepidisphaeraceae bacterium]
MSRGRPFIVVVLILSLAVAGLARRWAWDERSVISADPLASSGGRSRRQSAAASLGNMDSYALCLLLGGLRGPLVMFLWSSSETQKTEHDLEDFDTKVEWIRLLQPEFDTVHLFEIWNKAYNISVQMANLPNKYATILDALDYANMVDDQRPDDINIVYQIGMTYGDKLAGMQLPLTERLYYRRRVMLDTQWPRQQTRVTLPGEQLPSFIAAAQAVGMDRPSQDVDTDDATGMSTVTLDSTIADALRSQFPNATYKEIPLHAGRHNLTVKRTRLDPMLDERGDLLPALLEPTHPRPPNVAPDAPWYDGSRLQELKAYEPFPYGLTPTAISYNYYKRAQLLERLYHEEHIQTSDFVIDSRPALALKAWAEAEGEMGRRAECRLFGDDDSGDRPDLELRAPATNGSGAADLAALDKRPDPAAGQTAIFCYARAARLYRDARAEYVQHIQNFPTSRDIFLSHIADTEAFEPLYQADSDFLDGLMNPDRRADAFKKAIAEYTQARRAIELDVFRFYTDDSVAQQVFPRDPTTGERLTRENIEDEHLLPPEKRDALMKAVVAANAAYAKKYGHADQFADDRQDYMNYIRRTVCRTTVMGGSVAVTEGR